MTLPSRHRIRGRACYPTVAEPPHNTESLRVSGEETNFSFKTECQSEGRIRISDFPSRQSLPLRTPGTPPFLDQKAQGMDQASKQH